MLWFEGWENNLFARENFMGNSVSLKKQKIFQTDHSKHSICSVINARISVY